MPTPPAANTPVIIIGSGWAGLAAGIELSRHDIPVVLLESAKQPGGRARSVALQSLALDNGQHLMVGAYVSVLRLLRTMGVEERDVLLRLPLHLCMRSPRQPDVVLKAPSLPAPLHLLAALLTARGLTLGDKWRALRHLPAMIAWRGATDISVTELLATHRQPAALIYALWEPLCIGALNTPLNEASAAVFVRVLKESFGGKRSGSDLLVATADLGQVLPEPAARFIEANGGRMRYGERALSLDIENNRLRGVQLRAETLPGDDVVLATGPVAARRLLEPHTALAATATQLRGLQEEPICTIYLQYPQAVRLPLPLIGLLDGHGQWLFDRRHTGQPGLLSVVISSTGPHMDLDNDVLAAHIGSQIAALYPEWPTPRWTRVVREKSATFKAAVDCNTHRPAHTTPVHGLWLAGDYTDTGLPGTLEGAIRSGVECAHAILQRRNVAIDHQ